MRVGVVTLHREASDLLHHHHLQAGVVASGVGAELIDIAEARVKGLLVSERCKASGTHVLVAVQLDLIWLVDGAGADVIDAQSAARAKLALNSKAPFEEVGRLERAGREGVEVDSEWAGWGGGRNSRARIPVAIEEGLEGLIGLNGCVHGTSGYSGGDADTANLAVNAADEDWCVWRVHRAKVSYLGRNDVVEDTAAGMKGRLLIELVGDGCAWLINK